MAKPTADLDLKGIWNASGYRDLTLDCLDPQTGRRYSVRVQPKDMQRLINACADAVKQIGVEGPLDWSIHPQQIYWPEVTPWKAAPRNAERGGPTVQSPERPYCKPDQSCCDFACGN